MSKYVVSVFAILMIVLGACAPSQQQIAAEATREARLSNIEAHMEQLVDQGVSEQDAQNVATLEEMRGNQTSNEQSAADERQSIEIAAGKTVTVHANMTCVGDIEAEGEKLYERKTVPNTGLVVFFSQDTWVFAEWGTTCWAGDITADADAQQRASGCDGGCDDVLVIRWPESLGAVEVPEPTAPNEQATPTPMPEAPVVTAPMNWPLYESEGGIPFPPATSWSVDVAPDELEVITAGPAMIAGVMLPGGDNRGSVVLLLPGSQVVRYQVDSLYPGSNWHGSYRPVSNPTSEAVWRALADDRIAAMQQAPNCTTGTGCDIVDVLIIGPGPIVVAQWIVQ